MKESRGEPIGRHKTRGKERRREKCRREGTGEEQLVGGKGGVMRESEFTREKRGEGLNGGGVEACRSTEGAGWYKMFSHGGSHTHCCLRPQKNETHSAGPGGTGGGFALT